MSGIAAAYWLSSPLLTSYLWIIPAAALVLITLVKRSVATVALALAAGLLLGLWRGGGEQVALAQYHQFYGHNVNLQGVVSEDTTIGPRGDQRLLLKNIRLDGQPLHGKVWVSTAVQAKIKRSDIVTVNSDLDQGFGNLPASMFEARIINIERPNPGDIGLRLRDWFAGGIRRAIPEPQASLGTGYLVGQRSALPQDLDNQLKITGLTHAVVASGYNLTILVVFARRLFLKKSKYLAALSAVGMIVGFMLISGLSPSMSRAGLVSGLSLAAWYYGLRLHPLVLLPLAAAITALLNPAYLWGDIGWCLSFAAFTGMIMLSPLIQRGIWKGKRPPGKLRQIFFDTMSAQLATMPIMIYAFGHYSVYALLANLLVLPLIPFAMLLIFGAGAGALIAPGLAYIFGWPATELLTYMTSVVSWIANLPGAQGNLSFTVLPLAISYLALITVAGILWRKTRFNFRAEPAAENI